MGLCSMATVLTAAAASAKQTQAKQTQAQQSDSVNGLAAYVKSHPRDPEARLQLAGELAKSGYRSLSADQLQAADELQPGYVCARFHSFMQAGERERCLPIVFYVLRQNAADPDALLLTAASLAASGQADMARSVLEKAVKTAPRHRGLNLEMARLLNDHHQFSQAAAAAAKELSIDPLSSAARLERARALLEMGDCSPSVLATLQAASEQDPKNRDKGLLLARCLIRQGRYQQSLPPLLYNISAPSSPQEIDETDALLTSILDHLPGRAVKLQADKLAAVIKDPFMRGFFHMRLASVFDASGQYALANEEYLQCIATHSAFEGSASFHLARILDTKFQDPQRALPYYLKAAALKPYDSQIRRVVARMQDRCRNRSRDVAWQLKSFLWRNVNKAK